MHALPRLHPLLLAAHSPFSVKSQFDRGLSARRLLRCCQGHWNWIVTSQNECRLNETAWRRKKITIENQFPHRSLLCTGTWTHITHVFTLRYSLVASCFLRFTSSYAFPNDKLCTLLSALTANAQSTTCFSPDPARVHFLFPLTVQRTDLKQRLFPGRIDLEFVSVFELKPRVSDGGWKKRSCRSGQYEDTDALNLKLWTLNMKIICHL